MKWFPLILWITCAFAGEATAADPVKADLYHETLRPQFHFTAKQGWINDPNGLIYCNGQYHLFFQHTPGSVRSELKSWGHTVSTDLVHWTEIAEALSPDAHADVWSGSAVVDWHNSSGFGRDGQPPLVLIYAAHAHDNCETSLAYSNDGVGFTKFDGNPVIGDLKLTNRDPKVFWHEPTKRWVLALFVEENGFNNVRFYTSEDLRHWTMTSQLRGGTKGGNGVRADNFLYECPDIWEMPVEGKPGETRWIVAGANTEYMVGAFDGKTYTPETPKLPGHRGDGYYAPQTFNEEPHGRRVRFGWLWTAAPGMAFTQSMSLPSEHKLVQTPEGLRLTWQPVKELESLRGQMYLEGARTVAATDANPLAKVNTDLLEIRAGFTPGKSGRTTFLIRGVPVVYDAAKGEISVRDRHVATPLNDGKLSLIIYADRLSLEVYASDGLTYIPLPVDFKADDRSASVKVEGGPVAFSQLNVYELQSAWAAH